MATNDFLPFATGGSANVLTQAQYAALISSVIANGFSSGVAQSAQLNKVWRQSSIMAAVLGQFIADYSGQSAVDDGTTATLESNLKKAFNAAGITAPQFDNGTNLATTAFVQRALGNVRTIVGVSSATVLSAAHVGALIGCNAPANYTVTLPPMNSLGIVSTIGFFHNYTSGTVTIAGSGTEKIVVGGANQSSISLSPGQFIVLSTDLTTGWYVSSGNLFGYTQAVGDNTQNLATTAFVQNTLANSPALGGNPTATTPPANDNSTKLSTTAWVWNNIQSLVSSCISAVATSAGFAISIGTNGYVKFPSWLGGWIFQWGLSNITGNTDYSVSFPISFTTAVYSITNSNGYTQGSGTINAPVVVGVSPSLSSFVLRSTNNTSVYWMAVGK
ncbi:gp53-like domain-containing protein [Ralstonia mannitolilytica]|uniref:gp53-like domain-containing protein n=1 Tax=Ralstonia mannitolilytica TaxID=105219 RepID=UPI0026EF9AF6|nr:hypothetical protein [Ralstonia mannitolilytica]